MLVLTLVPYFLISLRTVYGGSWAVTIGKGAVMTAIYLVLVAATMVGVVVLTLLSV